MHLFFSFSFFTPLTLWHAFSGLEKKTKAGHEEQQGSGVFFERNFFFSPSVKKCVLENYSDSCTKMAYEFCTINRRKTKLSIDDF